MESKGPKNILALKTFKSGCEFSFGETEGMSEMESSIHIGIGEGDKELGAIRFHMSLIEFHLRPLLLDLEFILT